MRKRQSSDARSNAILPRFSRDEDGGITIFSLQIFVGALVVGGLAVDFGNGVASKTQLQVAADSAAHAALYTRELNSPDVAKATALEVAASNMPSGKYGDVLTADDISFGDWDSETQTFTEDSMSRNAVRVFTKRHKSNGNGVTTYMMGLVGLPELDVTSATIFETYFPTCFREGFVANDRVEIQSGSHYGAGFCIHSQNYVKASSNNAFDPGTIVSMPDKSAVELPNSGFSTNTGLESALRDGSYNVRILNRIEAIYRGLVEPLHAEYGIMTPFNSVGDENDYYRDYIRSKKIETPNYKFDATAGTFKEGSIHKVTCRQDKWTYDIYPDAVLKNAVLVTDCRLTIHAGATIEDAVIFVDNADDNSVRAPSGVTIGLDDDCAEGGDVQIVTRGGVHFSSDANVFGSQIIAAKDIELTANADGLQGVSLVAGGMLDVTSNGSYGFCDGEGMANNYEAAYFRLVR